MGALNDDGRAIVWDPDRQRAVPAARVLWEQTHGLISVGLEVMHLCDQPWCLNLPHLVLGSVGADAYDRSR